MLATVEWASAHFSINLTIERASADMGLSVELSVRLDWASPIRRHVKCVLWMFD